MVSTNATQPTPSAGAAGAKQQNTGFKLREYLYLCLTHWSWFVISVIICIAIAYVYVKRTTPIYEKRAAVLLKIDENGRTSQAGNAFFNDMGMGSQNSLLSDEIQIIKSPDLMQDVVRRLNLNMSYTRKGGLRTHNLYGKDLPVLVLMPDMKEDQTASFKLNVDGNGDFIISDMHLKDRAFGEKTVKGRMGIPVATPLGTIEVRPGAAYGTEEDVEITVTHMPVKKTAIAINGALTVETSEDAWNLVNMSIKDWSPERATDVLAQLIVSYNDRWLHEKREIAANTSRFIDERVKLLQDELGSVDSDISSFKSANLLPDVQAAAALAMNQASQSSLAMHELRNQEYMAKYIRNYLRNSDNHFKLLPTSAGITSPSVTSQITDYNTKLLERNSLVSQSSASNPLVSQLDQQINAMRNALIASIDNVLISLREQIEAAQGTTANANSRIAANPRQAKYLLSVERQQKVKETLYLYLLQKREENELNQSFSSYNTRMVREPDGSDAPIAPAKTNIFLVAFLAGLAIPALIIYQRENSSHVVRGRKDVTDMAIPFAGEIPLHAEKQKLPKLSLVRKNQESKPIVAVKPNCRNVINEAFRVLRTNLEFMFGNNEGPKVVMLTSANPASGKTFVTYNLAKSFAIKGKKVIAIDLDMRKAAVSKYVNSPSQGIADYLVNHVSNINDIIKTDSELPNLAVIPVGTLPPNPTELLFSDHLKSLIDDLKKEYDLIFIDCPPVEIVADASIISKLADYTLFVVRAGLFETSMLANVESMYEKGMFPSMSLVLNGTLSPTSTYGSAYGNPFSYGYGYGYPYKDDDK